MFLNINFLTKICIVGQNTFIHCSWITVAYVDVIFLSRIHPARHLDSHGIKPGRNSKMTDKPIAEKSNTASLGVE